MAAPGPPSQLLPAASAAPLLRASTESTGTLGTPSPGGVTRNYFADFPTTPIAARPQPERRSSAFGPGTGALLAEAAAQGGVASRPASEDNPSSHSAASAPPGAGRRKYSVFLGSGTEEEKAALQPLQHQQQQPQSPLQQQQERQQQGEQQQGQQQQGQQQQGQLRRKQRASSRAEPVAQRRHQSSLYVPPEEGSASLALPLHRRSRYGKLSDLWGRRSTRVGPPRPPGRWARWARCASRAHEGMYATALVVLCTLLALVLDDARTLCAPPAQDLGFSVVSFLVLVVLSLDTLVASLLRPGYLLSFFWWCDAGAVITLLPQISLFWGGIMAFHGNAGDSVYTRVPYSPHDLYIFQLNRTLHIINIFRLIRFLRLYQQYEAAIQQRQLVKDMRYALPRLTDPYWWQAPTQDRVGRRFLNLNSSVILLTIFAFTLTIPAFAPQSPYYPMDDGGDSTPYSLGLELLHDLFLSGGGATPAFTQAVGTFLAIDNPTIMGQQTQALLQLIVCNRTLFQAYPFAGNELRTVELSILYDSTDACAIPGSLDCLQSAAVLDVRWGLRSAAILSLCRTAFVLLMLAGTFFGFAYTANHMIIFPIDRLLKKVREVADNPLVSHKRSRLAGGKKGAPDRKWMEMRLLERMLGKICSLLVIGFGEAGAEVITRNLKDCGDLDPMVPGQQATAVFGFCDIRNFTDATEVLQTDIMEYVNTVARIVHLETALHGGAPNKNVGDAFLLVWKFSKQFRREAVVGHVKSRSSFQPQRDLMVNPAGPSRTPSGLPGSQKSSLEMMIAKASIEAARRQNSAEGDRSAPGAVPGAVPGAGAAPGAGAVPGAPLSTVPEATSGSLPADPAKDSTELAAKASSSFEQAGGMAAERRRRALDALFPEEAPGEPDRLPAIAASQPTFIPIGSSVQEAAEVADQALASAVIMQAMLKRSRRLQQFCQRSDIQRRMPGFQVRMGFGLHVGWAIEGAIGSEFKIDVSYLSPNVNLASRLEAATKQFGVSILLSGDFASLLSPRVQQRARQIDCVMVKGSDEPMAIYTYDVSLEHIPSPDPASMAAIPTEDDTPSFSGRPYGWEFAEHPDLASTWAVDAPFLARFKEGFDLYQTGNWPQARRVLEETYRCRRYADGTPLRDGPSGVLLDHMRGFSFSAPPSWTGCRQLTEK